MRPLFLSIALFLASCGRPRAAKVLVPPKGDRQARIFVPSEAPPEMGWPLVIMLHGAHSHARRAEKVTEWTTLADAHGQNPLDDLEVLVQLSDQLAEHAGIGDRQRAAKWMAGVRCLLDRAANGVDTFTTHAWNFSALDNAPQEENSLLAQHIIRRASSKALALDKGTERVDNEA